MSDSLQPHGLYSPWNFLGQNTGVGSLSLFQGIFPIQGQSPAPGGSAGKESACTARDLGSIPGLGRSPREGKGYLLQYSGLENSMLYSPWGCKESDMTERLSLHFTFKLHNSVFIISKYKTRASY